MRRSTFRLDVTGHEGPPDTPRAADRILLLIFLPYLTALVYIIAAGDGMTGRQMAAAQRARSDADIRRVTSCGAEPSPAVHVAQAQQRVDAGAITPAEFDPVEGHGPGLTRFSANASGPPCPTFSMTGAP